jgi:hypothetical protein
MASYSGEFSLWPYKSHISEEATTIFLLSLITISLTKQLCFYPIPATALSPLETLESRPISLSLSPSLPLTSFHEHEGSYKGAARSLNAAAAASSRCSLVCRMSKVGVDS